MLAATSAQALQPSDDARPETRLELRDPLLQLPDVPVETNEVDLADPVALVLGSEAHGLPGDLAARVEQAVTIPMVGRTESLNVGMAGTVLCFESLRQRRQRDQASDQGKRLDATRP